MQAWLLEDTRVFLSRPPLCLAQILALRGQGGNGQARNQVVSRLLNTC